MKNRVLVTLMLAIIALSSMYAVVYTPTRTPYSPLNKGWNGYSSIASLLGASISINPRVTLKSPKHTLYITVPVKPYNPDEASALRKFVLDGGVLVVLADKPEPANTLLREIGCSTRITGEVLLDPLKYYKVTALALALGVGNKTIMLDVASTLKPGGDYRVICLSSKNSFIDLDGNGYYTPGEPRGSFPVAVEERVGNGTVVVVGDPDVMINSVLKVNSGWVSILERYCSGRRVLIDVSHLNQTVHGYIASRIKFYGSEALAYGAPIAPSIAFSIYYSSRTMKKLRVEAATLVAIAVASMLVGLTYGFAQGLAIALVFLAASTLVSYPLIVSGVLASASAYTGYSVLIITPLLIYCLYKNPMLARRTIKSLAYSSLTLAVVYVKSIFPLALALILLVYGLLYSRIASTYLELKGYLEEEAYAYLKSSLNVEFNCRYRVNLEFNVEAPRGFCIELSNNKAFRVKKFILKTRFKSIYSGLNTIIVKTRVYDPLSLFSTEKKFRLNIPVKPLHKLAVKLALTILEEAKLGSWGLKKAPPVLEYMVEKGVKPKALIGDIAGVREYQAGDNPKFIHWKKSLSYRKLMVTERESGGLGEVIVLADLTCTNNSSLDKLLYTLLYTIDKAVIEKQELITLYVYNRSRVLLAMEKRDPKIVLKKLLENLSMLINNTIYTSNSVLKEGEPLYSSGGFLSKASRVNYELMLSRHPASIVVSRIMFLVRNERPLVKLIYDDQWFKHIYVIVKNLLVENGFNVIKPRFLEI